MIVSDELSEKEVCSLRPWRGGEGRGADVGWPGAHAHRASGKGSVVRRTKGRGNSAGRHEATSTPFLRLCRPKPDSKPDSKKRMVERAVAGHKGQNLWGKCAERVGTGRGVQREVF